MKKSWANFTDLQIFGKSAVKSKKMGSGGKKKEQSGDVTIEGAPDAAEGPSYEEKLR